MAINPMVDLTSKDWDALIHDLRRYARSRFPQWTDFTVSNFGNTLLELNAAIGDMLSFYQDNQANEAYLATVRRRINLKALCKLIGYNVPGAGAAKARVTFTIASPLTMTAPVRIPKGYIIRTAGDNSLPFQTLSTLVIQQGVATGSVDVENSIFNTEQFQSNGQGSQRIQLAARPYLDQSCNVTATNGQYAEVSSFLNTTSTQLHFTVDVNEDDRAVLTFGDGNVGAIPEGGISITYKVGGGLQGNVAANSITFLQGSIRDQNGVAVTTSVTNPNAASGGTDRQSIERARIAAPLHFRSLFRSVSHDDIVNNVSDGVPGVERVLLITSEIDSRVAENEGLLYVLATGGAVPTRALLDRVRQFLLVDRPSTVTFRILVLPAQLRPVNVRVTAFPKAGYSEAQMRDAIQASLSQFFSPRNAIDESINEDIEFGKTIYYTNIIEACEASVSVDRLPPTTPLTINNSTTDVGLEPQEFPVLGTVTVINGNTGLEVGQIPNLSVTSTSFNNASPIPLIHHSLAATPAGSNISPHLTWTPGPSTTVSYALAMIDLTVSNFSHWVVTNIPIPESGNPVLLANADLSMPAGSIRHTNGSDTIGYDGPYPPVGTGAHTYQIVVYALNTGLSLPPTATYDDFTTAITGRIVAQGAISGTVSS